MIVGYDISTAQQVEDRGRTFSGGDTVQPVERILTDHGATHIRLRLWVDPPYPYSDLPHLLSMARRVEDARLKLLLDFHYSDFWADPAKQPIPRRWATQDQATLARTVHDHTASVLQALADQGTPADIVQTGNEITTGMLWPQGKIYADGAERWDQFTDLLRAAIAGARTVNIQVQPRVMVHIDRGCDNEGSRYFFDHILERGAEFDLIGLSFYPWWHGTLSELRENLHDLARRYERPLVVVETAYPWTLENHDETPNIVTPDTALPREYPPTVAGQLSFLRDLLATVQLVPNGRGAGVVYWEPAWLPGVGWEPDEGNAWENLTLFSPNGHVLPSIRWAQDLPSGHYR